MIYLPRMMQHPFMKLKSRFSTAWNTFRLIISIKEPDVVQQPKSMPKFVRDIRYILLQHKLWHLCHSLLMRNNVNVQNHLNTSEAKINISTSLDDEIIYRIFKAIDGFRKLYYRLWDIREFFYWKTSLMSPAPTIGTIFVSLMSFHKHYLRTICRYYLENKLSNINLKHF